ncbi:hypothetical protein Tco_0831749 [Tanacetum coccineum]
MYYPRFTKVIIQHFLIQEKSLSWRNRIGMHTSKDDYLINTLRFVSRRKASQKYGAFLPECLTSPEIKKSKACKTYPSYVAGAVPPKIARKFKKASPSKKDSVPVQADEEPIQKSKRVKRAAKKSSTTLAAALTEEAQIKEVKKKSLRDFHKTCPSGSGTVVKDPPRVAKITPTVTSEGTGDKPGVPESSDEGDDHENKSEEQVSNSEQEEESKDDDQDEDEIIHTPSPIDDDNLESESDDVIEGDEEMDDTTNQFDDDVDARLKEPTQTDKEIVQESLMARIKEQVKDQLPQILPQEVSNFAPPVIQKLIKQSRDEVTLAKLKKILLDKMEKSESYLTAPEHRDCYDGLKKSYSLGTDI